METGTEVEELRRRLLGWYGQLGRDLPWRREPFAGDAYAIWVSEIMLQQTRVATAVPYYLRFLERYPRVTDLAAASEAEVLALWSGLGYYRRARQLLAAARVVVERHGGAFPDQWELALELPGIGAYTAGAILSIAFGQRVAAADANAARIAERVTGRELTAGAARGVLETWVDPRRPGDFNQALMDLGATVCVARAPECGVCPLGEMCGTRGELPRRKRAARVERVEEHYLLAQSRRRVWLRQRPAEAGQLAGMWELPCAAGGEKLGTIGHAITTRVIAAHVYAGARPKGAGRWMNAEEAEAAALTGLTRKVLRRFLAWEL